jgi:ABC-type oligopeptide transport system ATPase subunit
MRVHKLTDDQSGVQTVVDGLLTQVGLNPEDGEKYSREFSGGQRQRIAIARLFIIRSAGNQSQRKQCRDNSEPFPAGQPLF